MIIDTHLHYNLEPLSLDWERYLAEAQSAGVKKAIVVGTDLETSKTAVELVGKTSGLFATVGIHPHEALALASIDESIELLSQLISKKVVGIGETGLDYAQHPPEQEKEAQMKLFTAHIRLAKEKKLPLTIHCRDAYEDMLEILGKERPPAFVLHCMSGELPYFQSALQLGAYISFAGNVTYKNAEKLRELARNTPQNRIFVETDAPFLSPGKYRGKFPCEPAFITETVKTIADCLKVSVEECERITSANAHRFFGLDKHD
jgi:TatD DNase family protein